MPRNSIASWRPSAAIFPSKHDYYLPRVEPPPPRRPSTTFTPAEPGVFFALLRLPVELTDLIIRLTPLHDLHNLRLASHILNDLVTPHLPTRILHLTISTGRFLLSPYDPSLRLELAHFLRKTLFTLPLSRVCQVEELRIRVNDITGKVTRRKEHVWSGEYDGFAGMVNLSLVRIRSANTSRIWQVGQSCLAERVQAQNGTGRLVAKKGIGKDCVGYMSIVQALQTLIPLRVVVEVELRVQPERTRGVGRLKEFGEALAGKVGKHWEIEGARREKVTIVKRVRTREEGMVEYTEGRGKVGGELYIWSVWCVVGDLVGPVGEMGEPWKRCWEGKMVRNGEGMLEKRK